MPGVCRLRTPGNTRICAVLGAICGLADGGSAGSERCLAANLKLHDRSTWQLRLVTIYGTGACQFVAVSYREVAPFLPFFRRAPVPLRGGNPVC